MADTSPKRAPLLVHLIFQPGSEAARKLAVLLHEALNADPALPGLRVPTVIACEDGSGLPPTTTRLDDAERHVFVVLADGHLALERPVPPGRKSWGAYVSELCQLCEGDKSRRFIPFQLSSVAYDFDEGLKGINFIKAYEQPEATRNEWASRRLVVELCRFLHGDPSGGQLPDQVKLFVSHAKADIDDVPQAFNEIARHLDQTQPVKLWIDSGEIVGGSKFAEAIEQGVKNSLVLVLATRSYGARPWCRRELLLAKSEQRPFVVIEALDGVELRSFPYAGNAPRLRWKDNGAAEAVNLLLKEALRHVLVRLELDRSKEANDEILPAAPELSSVVRIKGGKRVLYPDPPLGDEEMDELQHVGVSCETPLQRVASGAKLAKVPIVLSISDAPDSKRHGTMRQHLDAALMEISRQLLSRGACLEYGGHLGSDGYTVALFDMAKAYAALNGVPPASRVLVDVGWPAPLETLPIEQRVKHQKVAIYRRIPRPAGLEGLHPDFVEEPVFFPAEKSPLHRYAWARGMSAMRQAQVSGLPAPSAAGVAVAKARIVLGGVVAPADPKGKWYASRIPGVVEEALLSLRGKQPLYLLGAYGGAAALLIDLLEGRPRPDFSWERHQHAPHAAALPRLYADFGQPWEDYEQMTQYFASTGVAGLSALNGLSVAQNRELFVCRDLTRSLELLLLGLASVTA